MTIADRVTQALRLLEPERAHRLAIRAARLRTTRPPAVTADPRLAINALGLNFPNPIGLAAGLDKDGKIADAMLGMGFGFVEIGTLTPLPQEGNPAPRLFRLSADRALINRLGFNNEGHEAALERLDRRAGRGGIIGVNIGANRESEDRPFDYYAGVRLFAPIAAYLTVNVSSPNTPGLRELQSGEALQALLHEIEAARAGAAEECGRRTPLLLKIAPDLDDAGLAALIETAKQHRVRRPDHRQHDGEAAGPEIETPRERDRWALRPPALRAVDGDAGARTAARWSGARACRRRWRRRRGGRLVEDRGRRRPGAALYRSHLRGAVAAEADRGRSPEAA